MLFPDPLLDRTGLESVARTIRRTHVLCSHCQKEIEGKVHRAGNRSYDEYCWYMRFVLGLEEEGKERSAGHARHLSEGTDPVL